MLYFCNVSRQSGDEQRRSHVDADACPYGTVPTFDTRPRIMPQTLRISHKERCPGQSPTTHSARVPIQIPRQARSDRHGSSPDRPIFSAAFVAEESLQCHCAVGRFNSRKPALAVQSACRVYTELRRVLEPKLGGMSLRSRACTADCDVVRNRRRADAVSGDDAAPPGAQPALAPGTAGSDIAEVMAMHNSRASTKTTPCTSRSLDGLAVRWGGRQDAGLHFYIRMI